MELFDSHAHYEDAMFNGDRKERLEHLRDTDVKYILNCCSDVSVFDTVIDIVNNFDFAYGSIGIHPHWVCETPDDYLDKIRELAKNPKIVAIGEMGLDYFWQEPKDLQKKIFTRQLELAKELDMPVIIHSRDAAQECFDMIKKSGVRKGIIHCYSGSAEMAMEYVKMGFYIGIGGVLTYSNARKTVEVAEEVPLNRIVLETDCPYLAPVPNRGKRNDSTMIKYVAEKLAEIKNISVEQVYFVTSQNAKDVFELKV